MFENIAATLANSPQVAAAGAAPTQQPGFGSTLGQITGGLNEIATSLAAGFAKDPRKRAYYQEQQAQRAQQNQAARKSALDMSIERMKSYGQALQAAGGIERVPALGQAIDLEAKNLASISGNPQEAAQWRNWALSIGTIPGKEKDPKLVQDQISNASNLAMSMLDKGADPRSIRGTLEAMKTTNAKDQNFVAGIDAIIAGLPGSQAEWKTGQANADLAASAPRLKKLIDAGIDPTIANTMVYGRGSTNVNVAGDLTGATRTDQQTRAIELPALITDLKGIKEQINPKTVGVWAAINTSLPVTAAAQIPGVPGRIVDYLMSNLNMGREDVNAALEFRSKAQSSVGAIANLILTQGGSKLTNDERQFAQSASGVFGAATTPEAAKATIDHLIKISERTLSSTQEVLGKGQVPGLPAKAPSPVAKPQDQGQTAPQTGAREIRAGDRATNPTTGEKMEFNGVQWVPLPFQGK